MKKPRLGKTQLQKLAESLLKGSQDYYSDLIGEEIRINDTETVTNLAQILESVQEEIASLESVRAAIEDPVEKQKFVIRFFYDKIAEAHGFGKDGRALIQSAMEQPNNFRSICDQIWFLKSTPFETYLTTIENIISTVFELDKYHEISNFLQKLNKTEDALDILQANLTRIPDQYETLEQEYDQIDREDIEIFLPIYLSFAAIFETQLLKLLGINRCLNNVIHDIQQMKKRSLGQNLQTLSQHPLFSPIVPAIRKPVRNAIAHGKYRFNPNRTIRFRDQKKIETLTYEQIIESTRELFAVIITISHLDTLLHARQAEVLHGWLYSNNEAL